MKIINKENIIEAINNSKNIREVFETLHCGIPILKRSCKFYNIKYPSFKKIVICDHNFFSEPNELSMYWAGFLAADGGLRICSSYSIKLELSSDDKNHIEKFKECLKSDAKIHDVVREPSNLLKLNKYCKESYDASYLVINSKKIFEDLLIYGITPRKTYTYEMPKWVVDHELVSHFIRGFIDGDGSFSFNKKDDKIVSIHFGLNGASNAVEQIFNIINEKCAPKYGGFYVKNNTNKLFWFNSLKDIKKIKNFLYDNSSIYLERKFEIIKEIDGLLEQSSLYDFDSKQLQELYDNLGSFSAVAKVLGCDRTTIRYTMHKMGLNYRINPKMCRK